jgi:hypothetical protein
MDRYVNKEQPNFLAATQKGFSKKAEDAVLRIRIRMFLGLLNPDPDPEQVVRGTDTDPSIIKQK